MPTPLSVTRIATRSPSRTVDTAITPPRSVYFAAFVRRFATTCVSRTPSPFTIVPRAKVVTSSCLRSSRSGLAISIALPIMSTTSISSRWSSMLPRVIREMSSRSSTSRTTWRTWRRITVRSRSNVSGALICIRSSAVRIGASGLRSSCPSIARNSSLTRFACSAALPAISILWRPRTWSVTSFENENTPSMFPEAPRIGAIPPSKYRSDCAPVPSQSNVTGSSTNVEGTPVSMTARMRSIRPEVSGPISTWRRPLSERPPNTRSNGSLTMSNTRSGPRITAMAIGSAETSWARRSRSAAVSARACSTSRNKCAFSIAAEARSARATATARSLVS